MRAAMSSARAERPRGAPMPSVHLYALNFATVRCGRSLTSLLVRCMGEPLGVPLAEIAYHLYTQLYSGTPYFNVIILQIETTATKVSCGCFFGGERGI